jgi:hypothetical protein
MTGQSRYPRNFERLIELNSDPSETLSNHWTWLMKRSLSMPIVQVVISMSHAQQQWLPLQLMSPGLLVVEIEIGREGKRDSKGRASICLDFLFENWTSIVGRDKLWSVVSHNGISSWGIKSPKSNSELIPNSIWDGDYGSSDRFKLS